MPMKVSYPDTVVGGGFIYIHEQTGARFVANTLSQLHEKVGLFLKANTQFTLNNEEFEENVCRNTPNCVCTEGLRGPGDAIHMVLNPIAKIIDNLAGTNLQGCGGCFERQQALNKA